MRETLRGRSAGKALLVLILALMPLLGIMNPVQAQGTGLVDDNTYVMSQGGDVIEWEAPWQFSEDLNYIDDLTESVGFINGAKIQSILYLPSGIDLEDARDTFLEGFAGEDIQLQTLDRGAYDNVSYSLDLSMVSDVLFGLFTVYIDNSDYVRSYATLAPYAALGEAVDDASTSITIDGDPIYGGVQGSGLQNLIDASAGDFNPTDVVETDDPDDGTDDGSAGDDEGDNGPAGDDEADSEIADYLATVRDAYDDLSVSVEDFMDLMADEANRTADDEDEMASILDLWLDAPDAAAALVAPAGYEDIQETYEDYAGTLADAADAYDKLMASTPGTRKSDRALGDLEDAFTDAETIGAELDDILADAEDELGSTSGSSSDTGDDGDDGDASDTGDAGDTGDSGDVDASAYLDAVNDHYDELSVSVPRFVELFGQEQKLSDADLQELNSILTLWANASTEAAALEVPAGYEDVQAAYEDYANSLTNASASFIVWLGAESGTPEQKAAGDDFAAYLNEAADNGAVLADELEAAGA